MIVSREPRNPDDLIHIPQPPNPVVVDVELDVETLLKNKIALIKATCEQEIATKANPQEQEGARNRIVLAMARKQAPLKADLDLLDWVEARRAQCEADVQRAIGE